MTATNHGSQDPGARTQEQRPGGLTHSNFGFRSLDFLRISAFGFRMFLLACLPLPAFSQSLWRDEISKPMFADKRAMTVGDLITIIVQENTTASKDNKTATNKKSSMDAAIATFLYSPAAS